MKKLERYLGEFLVLLGVMLSSFNILKFSHTTYGNSAGLLPKLPSLDSEPINVVTYYYAQNTRVIIVIGLLLLTLGILIIRNKKR